MKNGHIMMKLCVTLFFIGLMIVASSDSRSNEATMLSRESSRKDAENSKKHTCRRLLDSAAFDLHAGHFYTFVTIHKALIYRFYDDSTCMLMMPAIDF